jgi:hypothetical protein
MKKIFLLLLMSLFVDTAFACHTENTKNGTCVSPGNPGSVTGARFDPGDWDTNIEQGWVRSYNNGVTWEDVPGSNTETYVIHSIAPGYSSVLYMYWAKELSPNMGAVQNQVYFTWNPLVITRCGLIPVNLKFFEGVKKNDVDVELHWLNLIETSLDSITLERSTDAVAFTTIATFSPKGENTLYRYIDTGALRSVLMYYRLHIFNKDSRSQYSHIVKVVAAPIKQLVVTAWPIPTSGRVNLRIEGYSTVQKMRVEITDMLGRRLLEQSFEPQLSLERIPAGLYVCRVVDLTTGEAFVFKIQKQ